MISGRGSNMEAIMKACDAADYPAEITLVLSDNPEAKGLEKAANAGISAIAIPRATFASKSEHEAAISAALAEASPDLICLAGYMRLLSGDFTKRHENRLINIHPSLLPKFKGLDTHKRAIEAGEAEHGCTVHYVNSEMDGGKIIAQAKVDISADDTPDTLAAKVLVEEHILYPRVIKMLLQE